MPILGSKHPHISISHVHTHTHTAILQRLGWVDAVGGHRRSGGAAVWQLPLDCWNTRRCRKAAHDSSQPERDTYWSKLKRSLQLQGAHCAGGCAWPCHVAVLNDNLIRQWLIRPFLINRHLAMSHECPSWQHTDSHLPALACRVVLKWIPIFIFLFYITYTWIYVINLYTSCLSCCDAV